MNKKAAIALFLLLIPTASAIAPIIVAGLVGVGIIGALTGVVIWQQEQIAHLQDLNELLNQTVQSDYQNAKETINTLYQQEQQEYGMISALMSDFIQQGEAYAYTIGKYTLVKTLDQEMQNGTDFITALARAKLEAKTAVRDYYMKELNNSLALWNAKMMRMQEEAESALIVGKNRAATCTASTCGSHATYYVITVTDGSTTFKIGGDWSNTWGSRYIVSKYTTSSTTNCRPSTAANGSILYNKTMTLTNLSVNINYYWLKCRDTVDYWFPDMDTSVFTEIDAKYKQVSDNLDVYADSLTEQIFSGINVTELLDPITLATQINSDYDQTGYYGYAAAELALMGLNLTGLNKTVTIDVNGTQLSGVLFTDWEGILERNQTYTADPAYLWYFIDENGKLYDLQGYNFTVTDLRDKNGNELQNTTFERYVDHSGDIQKIYDELARLNELYQKYIEMQTVAGGGSGGVGDWWANLSDTEKLAIGAAAVLLIVLIARK